MAMDVPDDDMNIDASKRSTGITWKELAVIAATALSGYGIHSYFTKPPIPPSPPVTTTPAPDIPPDVPYSLEIDR